jgi:uncharacterized protein DUF5666
MSRVGRLVSAAMLIGLICVGVQPAVRAQEGGTGGGGGFARDEHGDRMGGRITAIGDHSITLTRREGAAVTVVVTDGTTFTRNGAPAKFSDFKVGDFMMAHGAMNSDGKFVASEIRGGDRRPEGHPEPH